MLLLFFIGGVHCSSESTGQGEDWRLESQDRGEAWAEVSYEKAIYTPACPVITPFIHLISSRSVFSSFVLAPPVCRVVELTGDVTPDMRAIAQADLIVTTPEKWDGVSRSWQNRSYVQKVALLIIDEIHLLGRYTHTHGPHDPLLSESILKILFVNFRHVWHLCPWFHTTQLFCYHFLLLHRGGQRARSGGHCI